MTTKLVSFFSNSIQNRHGTRGVPGFDGKHKTRFNVKNTNENIPKQNSVVLNTAVSPF